MARMSKPDQYKTVSAGMALGLLANGVGRLPNEKTTVELAFSTPWRNWKHSARFPAITDEVNYRGTGPNIYWILMEYGPRRTTPRAPFHWEDEGYGPQPIIHIRQQSDWTPGDPEELDYAAEMITDSPVIPASDWADLARGLLNQLGDD